MWRFVTTAVPVSQIPGALGSEWISVTMSPLPGDRGKAAVTRTSTRETSVLPSASPEDFRSYNAVTASWGNVYKNSHRGDPILCPSPVGWDSRCLEERARSHCQWETCPCVCSCEHTCAHTCGGEAAFLFCCCAWPLPSHCPHTGPPAFLEAHEYLYVIGWFSDENVMYSPLTFFFFEKKMKQAS